MLDPFRMATVRKQSDQMKLLQSLAQPYTRGRQKSNLCDVVNRCIQRSQNSIDALQQIRARSKDRRSSQKKPSRMSTNSSVKQNHAQTSPSFRYENNSQSVHECALNQLPVRLFSFTEDEASFRARDMPLQINMNQQSKDSLNVKQKPLIRGKQKENQKFNIVKNDIDSVFIDAINRSRQITQKYFI